MFWIVNFEAAVPLNVGNVVTVYVTPFANVIVVPAVVVLQFATVNPKEPANVVATFVVSIPVAVNKAFNVIVPADETVTSVNDIAVTLIAVLPTKVNAAAVFAPEVQVSVPVLYLIAVAEPDIANVTLLTVKLF